MAAQDKTDQMSAEKTQKIADLRFTEKLNDFLQKNRQSIFIVLIAIVAAIAALVIGLTVNEKQKASAFTKVDAFNERYVELYPYIAGGEGDAASKQEEVISLLDEINAFAAKSSGFAAARSYSLSAEIYKRQENWPVAEKTWVLAAKAAANSYIAPISYYNAATAAEEQGNNRGAIDLYKQALGYEQFPNAARAQFNIGRLEESENNRDAALEAYRNLLAKWPKDELWANLAQSRILVLTN